MENTALGNDLESVLLGIGSPSGDPAVDLGRLCNALSLLRVTLGEKSWVGLYLLHDGHLILGPFQGTPACEAIAIGKGVVGTCFEKKEPVYVEDVTKIENYICCDATARSEICIPLFRGQSLIGVLDIDLPVVHNFEKEVGIFKEISAKLALFLK